MGERPEPGDFKKFHRLAKYKAENQGESSKLGGETYNRGVKMFPGLFELLDYYADDEKFGQRAYISYCNEEKTDSDKGAFFRFEFVDEEQMLLMRIRLYINSGEVTINEDLGDGYESAHFALGPESNDKNAVAFIKEHLPEAQ